MGNILSIAFIVLFVLVFVPIGINVHLFYDVMSNQGVFFLKLFQKLHLVKTSFFIKNGQIQLLSKHNKLKQINLKLEDENLMFYRELQKSTFKRILLKKFQLTILIGVEKNAFLTSMLSGTIQMVLGVLFGYLYTKNKSSRTITCVNTTFKEEALSVAWNGKIYVSMIALFLSILEAYFKKLKLQGVKKEYGK